MNYREIAEEREIKYLSKYAAKARYTLGREYEEEKCQVRTEFQRDRDRIVHSKAFRRLMHKTQVFLAPEGDHYRTRLTHTIEVSQIARTIARALSLNEDLTEAIALGHDLGHTPFGHNGEEILSNIHKGGFRHNVQSLRVVEVLESCNGKQGMNLTKEVRNGILNHTGSTVPMTLEGQIVKTSDRIAYINHDIDDAIRSGVITVSDLPSGCIKLLGESHSKRINTLVMDMIENSVDRTAISMSSQCKECMDELRSFMFEKVYRSTAVKKEEDLKNVKCIIESLYSYYVDRPEQLPEEMQEMLKAFGTEEVVKDYVAGMTDRFAMNLYTKLFL